MRQFLSGYKLIILILLLFVLGNSYGSIFLIVALALLIIKMIYNDEESNFCLTCFLIPFIRVFDPLGVTFIVNLLFTVPFISGLIRRKIIPDGKCFAICTFLYIWELIHIIMFSNYSSLTSITANFITLFYCLCLLLNSTTIYISIRKMTDYFCCGVVFSAVTYLLSNPSYANGLINNVLKNQRFSGFAGEPNYYSLYICLGLSLIFILNAHKYRHYVYIGALIAIGLLTASKMCLLLIAFILVVGLVFNAAEAHDNKRKSFFYTTIACLIIAGVVFSDELIVLLNNTIRRMNISNGQFDLSAASTGRVDIVKSYLALCDEKPIILLLGYGINYHKNLNQQFGAHNTYMDLILSWGIPFSIVLITLWWSVLNRIKKREEHKNGLIRLFPATVLAINLIDLSCFSAGMFWLIITIAIVPIIYGVSDSNE